MSRAAPPSTYGRCMSGRATWIVLATAVASLLFAAVTTAGGVHLWIEPQWDPAPQERDEDEVLQQLDESLTNQTPDDVDESAVEIPTWLDAILRTVLVAGAIALVIFLGIAGWRNRPRLRWRRLAAGDGDFEVLPDVAAIVVDEASAQRAALLGGTPRNAIARCWLRLERDVAAAGLPRDPADTSVEFTARVLANYTVDPEAIHELAALYREARFSRHPLDESSRRSALGALDRLHQALNDSTVGAGDPTPGDHR